jgi:protein-tyrosine-phosphatase
MWIIIKITSIFNFYVIGLNMMPSNREKHRVVVVDTGNLCRSFMIERTAGDRRKDWDVKSAGAVAENGLPAEPNAIEVLEKSRVNSRDHTSKIITAAMIDWATSVVTTSETIRRCLERFFPQALGKTITMEVKDPYGKDLGVFESTLESIRNGLPRIEEFVDRANEVSNARSDGLSTQWVPELYGEQESVESVRVLILCVHNASRSPLYEGVLKNEQQDWIVESAGILAKEGQSADPNSITALAEDKIDISGHRTRMLTPEMLQRATCIIVLENGIWNFLKEAYPQACEKTITMNITDPFGKSLDRFRSMRDAFRKGLPDTIKLIKEKHDANRTVNTIGDRSQNQSGRGKLVGYYEEEGRKKRPPLPARKR